jgi:diadenylate cyclase
MSILHAITPLFEIAVIAVMLNYFLSFFWNTKSMDLVLGTLAFLLIFATTSWLHLPTLYKMMVHVGNAAMVAILVIFQPELRVALTKLSLKGKRHHEITEFDRFLDQLSQAIYRLADKRVGGLIILEQENRLDEYAQKAVVLNAQFSPELLESIFNTETPLHDGAVIIRGMTVVAASVILPLAEDSLQLAKSMGTRHRAALGLSQMTDALSIVISEETGNVSIAREGVMTGGIKMDRFKGIIRSLFTNVEQTGIKQPFRLLSWLKK